MKTKTFILACLFLGIGFTQLSAQSIVVNTTWDYWCPIYCDGVQVDYLTGTAIAHCVFHYDANGDLVWGNYTIRGEATSTNTDEDFSIKEKDKYDSSGIITWHYNLKGNDGSHYIGSFEWDMINDPDMLNLTINNAVCLSN
ncbi:MAG: hypothetical protein K8R63_02475 [Bacteroidales bacterium]|nr:hypothetical protein [Bacteroidales bacterium]